MAAKIPFQGMTHTFTPFAKKKKKTDSKFTLQKR